MINEFLLLYLAIGAILIVCSPLLVMLLEYDIDEIVAVIVFWPVVMVIKAVKGLIKILKD